jgi:hypothetical protein
MRTGILIPVCFLPKGINRKIKESDKASKHKYLLETFDFFSRKGAKK